MRAFHKINDAQNSHLDYGLNPKTDYGMELFGIQPEDGTIDSFLGICFSKKCKAKKESKQSYKEARREAKISKKEAKARRIGARAGAIEEGDTTSLADTLAQIAGGIFGGGQETVYVESNGNGNGNGDDDDENGGLGTGMIILIVVGGLIVIGGIIYAVTKK